MSVRFKFKNDLQHSTIPCDGLHISVLELKRTIVREKHLGRTTDFDLLITNQQTNEQYHNDEALIPKNSSLIVARHPLPNGRKKVWEQEILPLAAMLGADSPCNNIIDALGTNYGEKNENDMIDSMSANSSDMYHQKNWIQYRGRGGGNRNSLGNVCHRCLKPGHKISECSIMIGSGLELKRTTGIPRTFLRPVDAETPGAKINPQGVVMANELETAAYQAKKIDKPVWETAESIVNLTDALNAAAVQAKKVEIPDSLKCPVCQDLLREAIMMPACACQICDECARNSLIESDTNACPVCGEKDNNPDELIPSRKTRGEVTRFRNSIPEYAKLALIQAEAQMKSANSIESMTDVGTPKTTTVTDVSSSQVSPLHTIDVFSNSIQIDQDQPPIPGVEVVPEDISTKSIFKSSTQHEIVEPELNKSPGTPCVNPNSSSRSSTPRTPSPLKQRIDASHAGDVRSPSPNSVSIPDSLKNHAPTHLRGHFDMRPRFPNLLQPPPRIRMRSGVRERPVLLQQMTSILSTSNFNAPPLMPQNVRSFLPTMMTQHNPPFVSYSLGAPTTQHGPAPVIPSVKPNVEYIDDPLAAFEQAMRKKDAARYHQQRVSSRRSQSPHHFRLSPSHYHRNYHSPSHISPDKEKLPVESSPPPPPGTRSPLANYNRHRSPQNHSPSPGDKRHNGEKSYYSDHHNSHYYHSGETHFRSRSQYASYGRSYDRNRHDRKHGHRYSRSYRENNSRDIDNVRYQERQKRYRSDRYQDTEGVERSRQIYNSGDRTPSLSPEPLSSHVAAAAETLVGDKDHRYKSSDRDLPRQTSSKKGDDKVKQIIEEECKGDTPDAPSVDGAKLDKNKDNINCSKQDEKKYDSKKKKRNKKRDTNDDSEYEECDSPRKTKIKKKKVKKIKKVKSSSDAVNIKSSNSNLETKDEMRPELSEVKTQLKEKCSSDKMAEFHAEVSPPPEDTSPNDAYYDNVNHQLLSDNIKTNNEEDSCAVDVAENQASPTHELSKWEGAELDKRIHDDVQDDITIRSASKVVAQPVVEDIVKITRQEEEIASSIRRKMKKKAYAKKLEQKIEKKLLKKWKQEYKKTKRLKKLEILSPLKSKKTRIDVKERPDHDVTARTINRRIEEDDRSIKHLTVKHKQRRSCSPKSKHVNHFSDRRRYKREQEQRNVSGTKDDDMSSLLITIAPSSTATSRNIDNRKNPRNYEANSFDYDGRRNMSPVPSYRGGGSNYFRSSRIEGGRHRVLSIKDRLGPKTDLDLRGSNNHDGNNRRGGIRSYYHGELVSTIDNDDDDHSKTTKNGRRRRSRSSHKQDGRSNSSFKRNSPDGSRRDGTNIKKKHGSVRVKKSRKN